MDGQGRGKRGKSDGQGWPGWPIGWQRLKRVGRGWKGLAEVGGCVGSHLVAITDMSGYGWIRLGPGQLLSQVEADPLHDNPAGPSLCSITLASIVLTSWQILFLGTSQMMCWPATPCIPWPLMMVLMVLIALMDLLWTSHGPHVSPSWPCIQWHGIQ